MRDAVADLWLRSRKHVDGNLNRFGMWQLEAVWAATGQCTGAAVWRTWYVFALKTGNWYLYPHPPTYQSAQLEGHVQVARPPFLRRGGRPHYSSRTVNCTYDRPGKFACKYASP